jgi:ParB family chromosome partitioning protein
MAKKPNAPSEAAKESKTKEDKAKQESKAKKSEKTKTVAEASVNHALLLLPIAKLTDDPKNARKVYDEGQLKDLAESMRSGLMESVIVVGKLDGTGETYQIASGHRRTRAAKALGWKEIRCEIVESVSDADTLVQTLQVRLQPWELAEKCYELSQGVGEGGLTCKEIGVRVGLGEGYVKNLCFIKKNAIPDLWKEFVGGRFTVNEARDIAKGKPEQQASALKSRLGSSDDAEEGEGDPPTNQVPPRQGSDGPREKSIPRKAIESLLSQSESLLESHMAIKHGTASDSHRNHVESLSISHEAAAHAIDLLRFILGKSKENPMSPTAFSESDASAG